MSIFLVYFSLDKVLYYLSTSAPGINYMSRYGFMFMVLVTGHNQKRDDKIFFRFYEINNIIILGSTSLVVV